MIGAVPYNPSPSYTHDFIHGLAQGFHYVITLNPVVVATTERTLHMAFIATGIGAVVGIPIGAWVGVGTSPLARGFLVFWIALTRVPPVAAGATVVVLLTEGSPWGGGPLAGLHWQGRIQAVYFAQTLLAIPIIITLTATAVRGVPSGLLDQARAFGAPGWKRGMLAVQEARRRVLAGVLAATGVTITSIGAIAVAGGTLTSQSTLAISAFNAMNSLQGGTPPPDAETTFYPTQSLAVAFCIVLMGLFFLIAAAMTWLQEKRSPVLAGVVS